MLPKAKRLTAIDFSKRPLRRSAFEFGSIAVYSGTPKAAVVVSKKIVPKAVLRNKLRRRFYSILKDSRILPARIVVYPNKKSLEASFSELTAALLKALSR